MLNSLRKIIPERSPLRIFYHKLEAMVAAFYFRFPANRLKIIAVTGTSGKSTTVNLIHHLIQNSGKECGAISTLNFFIGQEELPNESLRTTLRPWQTHKLLRKMVQKKCEFCVLEVSSHAIDQHRIWGISIDTALLTNVYDNEHLDYHLNFAEYVQTKTRIFRNLNNSYRKPNVHKISILNRDDENFEIFNDFPADRKWTFGIKRQADVMAQNVELGVHYSDFEIKLPNHHLKIKTPIIGRHNVENLIAAISAVSANGVSVESTETLLKNFPGIPGRLEPINEGQLFSVIVDFSYKPSALEAVMKTLKTMTKGRLIVIFGGTGSRTERNLIECGKLLDKYADEIVLTTDDPNDDDPKVLASRVKKGINRKEGENFFEIEDRYEAIRYGVFVAEKEDCVLIAGRGHEKTQCIGSQRIPFDDREVAREILQFAQKENLLEK